MNESERNAFLSLLRKEVVPALGCRAPAWATRPRPRPGPPKSWGGRRTDWMLP